MNYGLLPYVASFVWPLVLVLLGLGLAAGRQRIQSRPGRWLALLGIVALALVSLPVGGVPVGRWLTGVSANLGLPLLALGCDAIARLYAGKDLLGATGRAAAFRFSVGAGLVLYPGALGWGSLDPYALGLDFSILSVGTGLLAAGLILRGNRFGLVLLAALIAQPIGLEESGNLWDYLVDPACFLVSLVALATGVRRRPRPLPEAGR